MGKSKTGGTRGYIRGRIANDVYSIGKDGKGKKQQVIRSLAESVANPRTSSQMFGRMIMSTVMQAVAGLSAIIDHSFDGIPKGQPSISEFIRRNYTLVAADAKTYPAEGSKFCLVEYQEKGAKPGAYIISDGEGIKADSFAWNSNSGALEVNVAGATVKAKDLYAALGFSSYEYVTGVGIAAQLNADNDPWGVYARMKPLKSLTDETVVTAANLDTILDIETNKAGSVTFTQRETAGTLAFTPSSWGGCATVIGTIAVQGGYIHTPATMGGTLHDAQRAADAVLPTYPTGTNAFLNGGEI